MDSRLNAIKDRIRGLINRNRQIDAELENNAQESKKEVLNAEKEQNNNEIRKERSNRYELQQISEDTEFNFNRLLNGFRAHYVEDAVVYEDLPSTMKDTYARNRRLGSGNMLLLRKYTLKFQ